MGRLPRGRTDQLARLVATCVAAVVLGASCASGAVVPMSGVAVADPSTVAETSAVRVVGSGCRGLPTRGGGAVVGADRVLTVAHVVAGSDELEVTFSDGATRPGVVVGIDRTTDLAVIDVETGDIDPVPLRHGTRTTSGYLVVERDGAPVTAEFTLRRYVRITTDDIDGGERVRRNGFEVEAEIAPGDSGTALVTTEGLAGVVFARSHRDDGRAWATAIDAARPLLDDDTGTPVDAGACPE
jgi:S1-C subfamily serine protease